MATERPPEQPVKQSLDESVTLLVEMTAGAPSIAGWAVDFILEDLAGTPLVTKSSPANIVLNDASDPKTMLLTLLKTDLVTAGLKRGYQYNYKFLRTDTGAEKRVAEGPWLVKEW